MSNSIWNYDIRIQVQEKILEAIISETIYYDLFKLVGTLKRFLKGYKKKENKNLKKEVNDKTTKLNTSKELKKTFGEIKGICYHLTCQRAHHRILTK